MKNFLISIIGFFLRRLDVLYSLYMSNWIINRLGGAGLKSKIHYPFFILGTENLYIDEGVNIGSGSTIFSTRAKIKIGKNTFTGPNVTMISGDHTWIVGDYMQNIKKDILSAEMDISKLDQDIVIEQDVWIGANVTILKGVHVGRGAIIAAGSIVNKNVLPYSIIGGNPARFIKFKWNVDEIIKHEEFLFQNNKNRMNRKEIENLFNSIK